MVVVLEQHPLIQQSASVDWEADSFVYSPVHTTPVCLTPALWWPVLFTTVRIPICVKKGSWAVNYSLACRERAAGREALCKQQSNLELHPPLPAVGSYLQGKKTFILPNFAIQIRLPFHNKISLCKVSCIFSTPFMINLFYNYFLLVMMIKKSLIISYLLKG